MSGIVQQVTAGHRARELIAVIAKEDKGVEKHLREFVEPQERHSDLIVAIMDRDIFKVAPPHPAPVYSEEEVEGIFALVMSLLEGLSPVEHDAVVDIVCAAVTSTTSKSPLLRLKIATYVYNTIADEHREAKLSALKTLIRFAADARLLEFLQSFIASAPLWATKWSLTPQQAGSLYLLFANSMEKCGALEESQGFLIRYLTTLEGASEAALLEARPWAKQAALNFIKAPAVSQRSNLSRLAAVRALSKDPEYARLYDLVDIFAHSSLQAYIDYHEKNSSYLKDLGVDNDRSVETMRLLTLCSLASASTQVTYDAIREALNCLPEEVESWVVKAVTIGLVDGKMNQERKAVTFTRSVQREFNAGKWRQLKSRLDEWSNSVGSMLKALSNIKGETL